MCLPRVCRLREFSSLCSLRAIPAGWEAHAALCENPARTEYDLCVPTSLGCMNVCGGKSVGWEMALMRNLPFIFGIQSDCRCAVYVTPQVFLAPNLQRLPRQSRLQAQETQKGNYPLKITSHSATVVICH
jgi:hypothetical protein